MEQIFGYIERITFHNEENGFTVAQLKEQRKKDLTCIVGLMPGIQPGETIRCFGQRKQHMVHGSQFEVDKFQSEAPSDIIGIQKYLGSGLVKGIGPTYAKKIVEQFGIDTLNIIDENPDLLLQVDGLGKKRVSKIAECWTEQRSIRDVMVFLQGNGVSPAYSQKIFKTYGKRSIEVVKENPYALARDIFGIGFKIADTIAAKLGVSKESPARVQAGIDYVLSELSSNGHVCYPLTDFCIEAEKMLEVPQNLIIEGVTILKNSDRIEVQKMMHDGNFGDYIWKKSFYLSEIGIAREIKRLLCAQSNLREINKEKALTWVQEKLKITLGSNQKEAVTNALFGKMQVITGGPGTGKSTITNAILTITSELTDKIILAAPTGRAAKRMTEITGKKASTIHSLLEFNFKGGGFKKNRDDPLDCDLIIVDESSMIDTLLMYSLLKAIPNHARVVLVGDTNQLPSVGAGNVLKDIIASGSIPVVILNEIYRQAAGSQIITNAHKINQGNFPDVSNQMESDFFFIENEEPEEVLKSIVTLVSNRLPKKYNFHPLNEIQVLAPMKKGVIGTENLNLVLQETLNPNKKPLMRYGRRYCEGDKVMQIKNDYERNVFNGDVGIIKEIDHVDQQLVVTMDDGDVEYEFDDLDNLVLAYAVSIHKYQGSECPCIVIPVHTTHFKLLHRNLLYTGVTRGKELVVVVGTKKAIYIAIKNDEVKKRYTGLRHALLNLNKVGPL